MKKTTDQRISLRTYLLPLKEKNKTGDLLFPFFLVTGELERNILHPDEPKEVMMMTSHRVLRHREVTSQEKTESHKEGRNILDIYIGNIGNILDKGTF